MKLSHLTDKILLSDTKDLVSKERDATLRLLYHLKEIDRRKLYSDCKCSSLFDYCVRELGYSEASAHRRIVAARMLSKIPEIGEKLEKGNLTLTNISLVNQFIKNTLEQKQVLKQVEGLSKKECEKKLFEITDRELPIQEGQRRIAKDKVQVAIILSDETLEKLEKLKALLGRDLTMDELIQYMSDVTIKEVEKTKFKQTKSRQSLSPAKAGRVISASVKREVYKRDQKCQICGTTHRLNFDHRNPHALGGESDSENIRLLCFHCNQRARIRAGLSAQPRGS
ncbi:MAG: HNH endonuclease [Bacteriovoracaceae bacterium]